jgi:N-acetylmuramic acid 6-phosphate etherase
MPTSPSDPLAYLLTEQRNPASVGIDRESTLEILRIINNQDHLVAPAVARELPAVARAVDEIVRCIQNQGRLFYVGAGTSGRLGVLDASECPPTFGVDPGLVQGIIAGGEPALSRATEASEDDPSVGVRDLQERGFTSRDALVGIAASGRTPYVLGAVDHAKSLRAVTAGISCTPDSELSRRVEIAITPLVGPEIITGSTRMKAGTATKLVLNMITTAVMIRMGYVYNNLMVNVQPRNHKLVERAKRIIGEALDITPRRAAELFELSGRDVRTAIVMGAVNASREEAQVLLSRHQGRVGEVLKER